MNENNQKDIQLGVVESKFADIIWDNEPISSSELAKRSEAAFQWKKTTSFTVLKRLCNKGLFKNVGGTVTSLIKRDEYQSMQSERFIDETFSGSLPAFLTAFTSRKALTPEEVSELRRMIGEYEEK